MTNPRLETFRALVAKNPDNPLARFGLANECMKSGLDEEALEHLMVYLEKHDDEGNGYGRLAEILQRLGRSEEARAAFGKGIDASHRFGHVGMANELQARLEELGEE